MYKTLKIIVASNYIISKKSVSTHHIITNQNNKTLKSKHNLMLAIRIGTINTGRYIYY